MIFQCRLKIESHIDHGTIIIGGITHQLEKKTYEYEFSSEGSTQRIVSLSNLKPGLDRAVEISGLEIDSFSPPDPKHFLSFQMINNRYVDNRVINETNLVFNGDLSLEIHLDRLLYFPHYYSKKELDFVNSNNHLTCTGPEGCWDGEESVHNDLFPNLPYDPSIRPSAGDDFALGCSFTYGTAMDRSKCWPSLIGYKNFGLAGCGIDAIFYNATQLIEIFKPKKIMIVFPNLERRLLEFKSKGHHFRIPNSMYGLGELYQQDHYWIDSKELKALEQENQKLIIEDKDNVYSKSFLEKISKLPCDIGVSSWSPETYETLPKYFKNILPFFEKIDLALDGRHPGVGSHKNWVEEIKNHNI